MTTAQVASSSTARAPLKIQGAIYPDIYAAPIRDPFKYHDVATVLDMQPDLAAPSNRLPRDRIRFAGEAQNWNRQDHRFFGFFN
ncbi:hypothetical protein FRC05_006561 [Tulasnella sp. 425]|nr:hypothetical protein FRC05_006561 [Tulasnella sp. 425]